MVELRGIELYRHSVVYAFMLLSVYRFVYHLSLGTGFNSLKWNKQYYLKSWECVPTLKSSKVFSSIL